MSGVWPREVRVAGAAHLAAQILSRIISLDMTVGLSAVAETRPPDIVCFVADDFGVHDAACYGNRIVETPHIDRLAADGVRFTCAFAGSPTCAPSRSILYTGLMSARTDAHPNHWPVRSGTKSVGHYLAKLGYHVAVFNKVHVNPEVAFPFERIKASRPQADGGGRTIDPAILDRWLVAKKRKDPDQPLCLFLCDNNTHLAWPSKQHRNRLRIEIPEYLPQTEDTRESLARYYSEVELLDTRVGECIDVLKKHAVFDDALFVFTADQGPAWLHGKWNLYDLGIHVPFIVRWPAKTQAGTTCGALVSLADLTPLFVEVAGGIPDENLDGRSFVRVLRGENDQHRDEIYATHTGDGTMNNYPCRCIRTERFKLIWNLRAETRYGSHLTGARGLDRKTLWQKWQRIRRSNGQVAQAMDAYERRPEFELYDVVEDPRELVNLAQEDSYRSDLRNLKRRLEAWMQAQQDGRQDMAYFLNQKNRRR